MHVRRSIVGGGNKGLMMAAVGNWEGDLYVGRELVGRVARAVVAQRN